MDGRFLTHLGRMREPRALRWYPRALGAWNEERDENEIRSLELSQI